MEPMRMLSRSKIQYGLEKGKEFVERYVYKPLGLNSLSTIEEVQKKIRIDLTNMHFKVDVKDSLPKKHGKEIPSFIYLKGDDRKNGGIILLNKKFPINCLREACFHEYSHIKDDRLPIHTTNKNAFNSKTTYERLYMKHVEFLADMNAYSLMMPIEKLKKELLDNRYNISEILKIYSTVDKSSVLRWIVINNHVPCHFIYIVLEKDHKNNILQRIVYDDCFYDHQSDPVPFPVDTVLASPDSAASIAMQTRAKDPIASLSVIKNINMTPYFCYAYYEEDVSKDVIENILPYLKSGRYDRLLVIGWTQSYYEMIIDYHKHISRSEG
jgi:hypothetical protein